jgi:hypothetical protein
MGYHHLLIIKNFGMKMNEFDITNYSDDEVISLYPKILKELKNRNIIRTNNLVGDLGEFWCIKI